MSLSSRIAAKSFQKLSPSLVIALGLSMNANPFALPAMSASTDQAELQRGIQSFSSKHYSDAIAHLQFYVNANPHDSLGHYYMANCLFCLGYQQPCIDEYTRALNESTSQKMTDYCRDAIRSMQKSKAANNTAGGSLSSGANARVAFVPPASAVPQPLKSPFSQLQYSLLQANSSNNVLGGGALVVPPLTVDPVLLYQKGALPDIALQKTLSRMVEQTNNEIVGLQKDNEAELQSIKNHLNEDIFKLNRDCETRIQAAIDSNQRSTSSTRSSLEGAIESIRKDTQTKIENAKSSAESKAQELQRDVLNRASRLIAASQLSQSQVADCRKVPGSPNLQLTGSDLYTRNYAPSPEPPPPDELLATPERLVIDAHSSPGRKLYRVVRDPAPPPAAPGTDLKVHGELVK